MKIAIGSDEKNELTTALLAELATRGHEVLLFGAVAEGDPDVDWTLAASHAAEAVASGSADEGMVLCWTGTGASIAANKVRGIRAALVHDGYTAKGARIWNHANVLALSLRATSVPMLKEILEAWFATPMDEGEAVSEWNLAQMERLKAIEGKYQSHSI
jgi:ribose 5-phosphate isomerase B